MSRIIIGDVHGCYRTLEALISKLPQGVPLTFVGDLVDRGPASRDVVQFVMLNKIDCVLANHEDMMIAAHVDGAKDDIESWLYNGGEQTLYSYSNNPEEIKEHIEWMKTLPLYIEYPELKNSDGRYLVVSHAGLGGAWKYRDSEDRKHFFRSECLWNRDRFEDVPEIYNVHGHTPQFDPRLKSFYANIDTGACFTNRPAYGRLTALQFPELILYQQENIDEV